MACRGMWAAMAVLVAAGSAPAQLRYAWADTSGNPVSSATITTPGGAVMLRVYVVDTSSGAGVLTANGGLGSAGVRASFNSPGGVVTAGAFTAGSAWEFGNNNDPLASPPANSKVLNLGAFTAGVLPAAGDNRVLLGTITLTGLTPGSTDVSLIDPNPLSAANTTWFDTGDGLDNLFSGTPVVTVTYAPVPEPTGLLAVLVVGVGMAVRRMQTPGCVSRRRQRRYLSEV